MNLNWNIASTTTSQTSTQMLLGMYLQRLHQNHGKRCSVRIVRFKLRSANSNIFLDTSNDFNSKDINEITAESSSCQSVEDNFNLKFNNLTPIHNVEDYKSFSSQFGKKTQRSSTPTRGLVGGFDRKGSLFSDEIVQESMPTANLNRENELKRRNVSCKEHSERLKKKSRNKVKRRRNIMFVS